MNIRLSTIDIVIIFAYLAIVITLGMWVKRFAWNTGSALH